MNRDFDAQFNHQVNKGDNVMPSKKKSPRDRRPKLARMLTEFLAAREDLLSQIDANKALHTRLMGTLTVVNEDIAGLTRMLDEKGDTLADQLERLK
jgi:hypothetical protein